MTSGAPGGAAGGNAPGGWQAPEQGRFDSFRPEEKTEPASEPEPTPQIRNGRVLLAVLAGAALLLIVPFAIVWAVTRPASGFEIGSCVKRSGTAAVAAKCGESGTYKVVDKAAKESECPDPSQPAAVLSGVKGKGRVLCLKPADSK